jgi:hypothetical protein
MNLDEKRNILTKVFRYYAERRREAGEGFETADPFLVEYKDPQQYTAVIDLNRLQFNDGWQRFVLDKDKDRELVIFGKTGEEALEGLCNDLLERMHTSFVTIRAGRSRKDVFDNRPSRFESTPIDNKLSFDLAVK